MSFDPIATDAAGGYYSVWSDRADHVWFTEATAGAGRLLYWEDEVVSSEVSGCGNFAATIRGSAASDLWLAGCNDTLAHRSGTHWASLAPLEAKWVWVNSATDVWSCCQQGPSDAVPSALNWNGSTWEAVPLPSTEYSGGALWSGGHDDLWIADRDLIHWNGTAWDTHRNDYVASWRDVWSDGTNVWGVGHVLARWTGSDFEELASVNDLVGELEGVWARAPNDVWFVGMAGAILHWDGQKLERESVALVDPNQPLFGVWGTQNALWVVGAEATLIRRTLEPLP